MRTLFEDEEDYYQPKRVSNFWNNYYIECESNGDTNKNLSLEEYLKNIKPYWRDVIVVIQESDTWKIQLAIAIHFIYSKDTEEECVMHSKSNKLRYIVMQMKLLMNSLSHFVQDVKLI